MTIQVSKYGQMSGHNGSVYTLEQADQPHLFYTGSSDKIIGLWDLKAKETLGIVARVPAIIFSLCYIPEKNYLLAGTSVGSLHVLDLTEKKEIKIFSLTEHGTNKHIPGIFDIKYSLSKDEFYCTGGDGTFTVCRLSDLTFIRNMKLCSEKARSIAVNEKRNEMIVTTGDGSIIIFDLASLEEKKKFTAHKLSCNAVQYHPNGRWLLSGGRDAHLRVWDLKEDYKMIREIPAHNYAIYSIVFSPDQKLIATGSRDKTIKIWDMEHIKLQKVINKEKHEGHSNSVNKLLWSKYHDLLISTGDDRNIMMWEISS